MPEERLNLHWGCKRLVPFNEADIDRTSLVASSIATAVAAAVAVAAAEEFRSLDSSLVKFWRLAAGEQSHHS